MYTSILHGLLTGFLFPLYPWFFFRDQPLPNFFDADAEATVIARSGTVSSATTTEGGISERVAGSALIGGEMQGSVIFGKRMQVRSSS